jgi:hypothetical protein
MCAADFCLNGIEMSESDDKFPDGLTHVTLHSAGLSRVPPNMIGAGS